MKLIRLFSAFALVAAMLCSCQTPASPFVKIEDGKFVCQDYPSYFIGTNLWYGSNLASEGFGGDRERLHAELDTLKALGINNLRVLVGGDGLDGVNYRIGPTLQKEPGVYNDTIFRGLDYLLAEMAERGMKAVLYLNNSWEWSGGYGAYLEWAGAGEAIFPVKDGYWPYVQSVAPFVTNEKAKEFFYNHVKHVVSRTNTVTGKPYKDDPTIFSWQIGNEPRAFRSDSLGQAAFVDYMWKTAGIIKSIDPNHLVSSGSEGMMGCEESMELFEKVHACPDIDYMNIHIWPYNWRWVPGDALYEKLPEVIAMTDKYIEDHMAVAEKYGKPLVLEEFGYPRDGVLYDKDTPTTARDVYYEHVLGLVAEAAAEGSLFAGVNFWSWSGFAGQSETNLYWQMGDDYCGDPAQEPRGFYSIYCGDSTVDILREATERLQTELAAEL